MLVPSLSLPGPSSPLCTPSSSAVQMEPPDCPRFTAPCQVHTPTAVANRRSLANPLDPPPHPHETRVPRGTDDEEASQFRVDFRYTTFCWDTQTQDPPPPSPRKSMA